jgi:hypothetical protein
MEWLLEVLAEILISADFFTLIADFIAWRRGERNRLERREARRAGLPPPPRDGWNKSVIWLTAIAVLLTGYIVWRVMRN